MTVVPRRSPVVVGRDPELDRLRAALEPDSGLTVVSICGEAGIGKTRLVDEALDRLDGTVVVLRGSCHPADRDLPFGPFVDLAMSGPPIATLDEALATLDDDGSDGDRADLRRRATFDALAAALLGPDTTVVVLEDVHWADEISLDAIAHLARRIGRDDHRLVLTYRPGEGSVHLSALLAELTRQRCLDEIELAPLDPAAVAELAAGMVGAGLMDEHRRLLSELSDGNPFHVEELVRSTGGDLGAIDRALPRSVSHSVVARLAALDDETRRAAATAAIVGRDVPVDQLAALLGWDDDQTVRRAGDLIAAGLLREIDGRRLRFVHELARRAVESELLAVERTAIHRDLVTFLSAGAADDRTRSDLARHAFEGGLWEQAVHYGTEVATTALAQWSAGAALSHLDRAVAAAEHGDLALPTRVHLLRANARRHVGDLKGARSDLVRAIEGADASGDAPCIWESRFELAQLDLSESSERGEAGLAAALDAAQAWGDPSAIARTLNRQGNLATNQFDFARAHALLDEAMRIGADDDRAVAEAGTLLLVSHSLAGDLVEARRYGAEAIERLRRLDDRVGLVNALFSMAMTGGEHLYTDTRVFPSHLGASEREAREALELATSLGWTAGEALSRRVLGGVLSTLDRPAEAIALFEESIRQADAIGHLTHRIRGHVMFADALLNVGDTVGARHHFERAIEIGGGIGIAAPLAGAHSRLVEVDIAQGRIAEAAGRWASIRDAGGAFVGRFASIARIEVALAQGDLDEADAAIDAADDPESAETAPRLLELRGLVTARRGRLDEAGELLLAADHGAERTGLRQRRRLIVASRARIAAQAGDRTSAARLCEEAWQLTADAAVGLDDERAAQLRADMERRTSGVPRSGAPSPDAAGAATLTAREAEVAVVLARGLTNQQIADELYISVRTAETHVKRILAKLGLSSRGQVAHWVHEHGLDRH